jgi:predicted ATPase
LTPVGGPFSGAIVDALRRLDRLDEAMGVAERWLGYSSEIGAPYWDAEFLRQQGEILLAQDPAALEEAERLFRRAIAIAESQEGKFHELRGAMSLARLWQRQGKPAEARDLLAPVHGWFTEGFDTQDLKDAKALLEELA